MWWGNRELELQEWEDCMKYKKTRILSIIMLFPNKNLPLYKEDVIYNIVFAFGGGVKSLIGWKI